MQSAHSTGVMAGPAFDTADPDRPHVLTVIYGGASALPRQNINDLKIAHVINPPAEAAEGAGAFTFALRNADGSAIGSAVSKAGPAITPVECALCMEEMRTRLAVMTACHHRFHRHCLTEAIQTAAARSCPICREDPLPWQQLPPQ
jgi:hypothetical protein